MVRNLRHHALADEHTLRAAKSAKGGVRDGVGLSNASPNMYVGNLVYSIHVGHGTFNNRTRKILRPAAVVEQIRIKGLQLSVLIDSNFPTSEEWVTLS